MALVPGQISGERAWQILPLLFPGCVILGKPVHLSEHLDPHLETAYHLRFDERTKRHDVCGRDLETVKCTAKVSIQCIREATRPGTPARQPEFQSWPHLILPVCL